MPTALPATRSERRWRRLRRKTFAGLRAIWQARRSPNRAARALWWGFALLILAVAVSGPQRANVFRAGWTALNTLVALVAGCWGLFHPRSLTPVRRTVSAFSLIMTALGGLFLLSLQDFLTAQLPGLLVSSSLLLLIALVLFPIVLIFFRLVSVQAASIGAFSGRHLPDSTHSARYALAAFWLTLWISCMFWAQGAESYVCYVLLISAPLAACLGAFLAPRLRINNVGTLRRLVKFLERHFRWRLPWRHRIRWRISWRKKTLDLQEWTLDMRGAFLGCIAALGILLFGLTGLIAPLQGRLLALLVQFRSAPAIAQLPTSALSQQLDAKQDLRATRNIVLLHLDGTTRRAILRSGSEVAMQARILRILARYHCRSIVLPLPLLDPNGQLTARSTPEMPVADFAEIQHSNRDLPKLVQAIKAARNVTLSLPDDRLLPVNANNEALTPSSLRSTDKFTDIQTLAQVAAHVGYAGLDNLQSGLLPAIPLGWTSLEPQKGHFDFLPPLPLILYAVQKGMNLPPRFNRADAYQFQIGSEKLPVTSPGQILISYFAGEPNAAFATLNYETILNETGDALLPMVEPPLIPVNEDEKKKKAPSEHADASSWVRLDALLTGKIVFLEGMDVRARQTPIGGLTEPELMAHATATLLTRSIAHRLLTMPMAQVVFTSFLLAAWVGNMTLRRDPLQAGLRAVLIISVFAVVCLLIFLFAHIWIDMVIPLLAGMAAYLLVVQYTFAVDKWEMSRNRELLEQLWDKETVNQLLENGYVLELGGVSKRLCVLFADVRGFSTFASTNSPEVVVYTINEYLKAMSTQIMQHQGVLDKFLGDGLLALFGVPEERPDDAIRAVQSALAMQKEAARVSEQLQQEGLLPLGFGIGVHFGEAIFGLVGSTRKPDLTAIGHTVVLAQRIQGTALAGEVVLSEELYRKLAPEIIAEARPPMLVKGIATPVNTYRLLGFRQPGPLPENPPLPAITSS